MNQINNQLKKIEKHKNNPSYQEAYKLAVVALKRQRIRIVNQHYMAE